MMFESQGYSPLCASLAVCPYHEDRYFRTRPHDSNRSKIEGMLRLPNPIRKKFPGRPKTDPGITSTPCSRTRDSANSSTGVCPRSSTRAMLPLWGRVQEKRSWFLSINASRRLRLLRRIERFLAQIFSLARSAMTARISLGELLQIEV